MNIGHGLVANVLKKIVPFHLWVYTEKGHAGQRHKVKRNSVL